MNADTMRTRVALVTGAASGLGAETAALLAREGADVVFACDVRAEPLRATVDRLRSDGLSVDGRVLDVSDEESLLRSSGSGAVVNISSVAGVVGIKGIHAGYTESKGGLRTMTKAMALEMAPDNIRVNSVHTGAMPAMQGSA